MLRSESFMWGDSRLTGQRRFGNLLCVFLGWAKTFQRRVFGLVAIIVS